MMAPSRSGQLSIRDQRDLARAAQAPIGPEMIHPDARVNVWTNGIIQYRNSVVPATVSAARGRATTGGNPAMSYKLITHLCPQCGDEFQGEPKQKYCSIACRGKSYCVDPRIRFAAKTTPGPNGCIDWTATTDGHGYGHFSVGGKTVHAYVFAWTVQFGPAPEGKDFDHLCRRRICVNPFHLEPVTHRENMLRGNTVAALNHQKTHCAQGHQYSPENTRFDVKGARRCVICRRAAASRHWRRKHPKQVSV